MSESSQNKTPHIILVLAVFSITGLTVARLGVWLTYQCGAERFSSLYWMIWIFGLLPLYNVVLLLVAAIFGKYPYFRAKQKKTWQRIAGFWRGK